MKRYITKIEYLGGWPARVLLDDGSELCGLRRVETDHRGRPGPTFTISGYVLKQADVEEIKHGPQA